MIADTKKSSFNISVEILDKILSASGPFMADHLMELYRRCNDEASKESFVAMLIGLWLQGERYADEKNRLKKVEIGSG